MNALYTLRAIATVYAHLLSENSSVAGLSHLNLPHSILLVLHSFARWNQVSS